MHFLCIKYSQTNKTFLQHPLVRWPVSWFPLFSLLFIITYVHVSSSVATLWLTSFSTSVVSVEQTDHINIIDAENWLRLKTCRIWFPVQGYDQSQTYMHVNPGCWLVWSVLCFRKGRWVISLFTVCMHAYFSLSPVPFIFPCPFSSTFTCPPKGRGLTTGWGSMNCCVVLSQRRILFRSPPGG